MNRFHIRLNYRKILSFSLLIGALLLLQPLNRSASPPEDIGTVLRQSWQFYKDHLMVNGERVASNNYGGTITEGQSYAMLKAVWMDDRTTFDKVWRWTRQHMSRPGDRLFGWRWGKTPAGGWGLLHHESATDADQDIAYALLLAGERWKSPAYTAAAKAIINDLWRLSVVRVKNRYYLSPGDWEPFKQNGVQTLDPSYFAPYVYRKFAEYDTAPGHHWRRLADDIYPVLEACTQLNASELPPNWCGVRFEDGQIVYSDVQGPGARDFSYDAFRVFWRMGMDAKLGSRPAREYLQRHQELLTFWEKYRYLPEGFTPEGNPRTTATSGFALSAALALNHAVNPSQDQRLYREMLSPHYHAAGYWFNDYNDYLHSVIWLHLYTLMP